MNYREHGIIEVHTADEWTSVLHLADKWGFKAIKILAVAKLVPVLSPVDMIVLGRRYSVNQWFLLDAYDSICLRPEPLSLDEGYSLGMESVIKIMSIRQEYDLGTRSFTSPPIPTLEKLRIHFGLLDAVHPSAQPCGPGAEDISSYGPKLGNVTKEYRSNESFPKMPHNGTSSSSVPDTDMGYGLPYWSILTKDQYFARIRAEADTVRAEALTRNGREQES